MPARGTFDVSSTCTFAASSSAYSRHPSKCTTAVPTGTSAPAPAAVTTPTAPPVIGSLSWKGGM